jgi:PAS domain S-box-containing protein
MRHCAHRAKSSELPSMSLWNPAASDWRVMRRGDALCLGGAALGAIGLTGWLTGAEAMVTIVPGQPPMMPNTAFALMLLGTAGAMRVCKSFASVARSLSVLLAIVVLATGLVTLAEYAVDLPFSIDQLLLRIEAGPYPGRPSPPTALALVFLAAGVLLWNWRPAARVPPVEWLTLLAGLIAFTALLGQAFGAGALYRLIPTPTIGVAVHTALGLLLISAGSLLERPGSRLARIASSPSPGDLMLRQLALAFILMAVSIGFAGALLSELLGSENAAIIAASLTVIGIVVGLSLLAVTARQLNNAHQALERSRQAARDLIEQASEGIYISDLEGRFVDVNGVGCRMSGYSREEILRKTIADVIPPEDVERLRNHRTELLEGHTDIGEWTLRRKDGSYLPVEVSAKILPDGRWLAFSRDISERKRSEERIRQAQERLSSP